ncbi:protein phosphatase, putative [Plasmodium chabaudi adami]|uniref:Protein phosphatase, putative n=1 Tax=Plasmodium chabaudi adami TaxID=5826 RepID=A0A1C6Y7T1_PLACE|nr:protein phosphatase, putative [Plasmodium chabaudi adami]
MEYIGNIYDKVLSGYVSAHVLKYKSWEENLIGNEACKNDSNYIKKNLEEILGTFVKNGKFSHSLWEQHKMFIGDEGIYLLGEIITICQIVQFIDSDDIENVQSNEEFKTNLIEELKRRLIIKKKTEILEEKIISNISMCNGDNNFYNNYYDDDIDEDEADNNSEYDNYQNNNDSIASVSNSTKNDSNGLDSNNNTKVNDKNAVSNFVEMLCAGKANKYGFCEYDHKFNDKYNLKNIKNEHKSSKSIEHSILSFSEDYDHKYVCLLLNNSGIQELRILRFSKDCINTNKLLDTLKGTVTFLNELRHLFKYFRSQIFFKDKIYGEFCAYIKFHKSDPNFSGTKALNEFFNSLNDNAIKYLFFGLNEDNLNLLEEAISYCPIATFSFFKNIKLLKNMNVNSVRRTWKAVCSLQKIYKNYKKMQEQSFLDDMKYNTDEYNATTIHQNVSDDGLISLSRPPGNRIFYNLNESIYVDALKDKIRSLLHGTSSSTNPNIMHSSTGFINSPISFVKCDYISKDAFIQIANIYSINCINCINCKKCNFDILVGSNKENKNELFSNNSNNNIEYNEKAFSSSNSCNDNTQSIYNSNNNMSLDLYSDDKSCKKNDINKLNDTCLYVVSDEDNIEMGKKNLRMSNSMLETNHSIDDNNKTLLEGSGKLLTESGYKSSQENKITRDNSIDDLRINMVKLFKTYGGQCRIGKVQGRCEDATFQTDTPPAFGIFDGVGSWSLEGIDASKFSIGLSLACQREAEKLSKNINGYENVSYNTIIRSKLLLKNSLESVKKEYADAYGSSTAIVGILDEYTGKCGISSLGDSVCMILRREFLPGDINFERETYPKFPVESFLYVNSKGRNPSIIRKIIWKTTDQKWENGAPYQLSNLPDRSQWKDLEARGLHSFVKILERVDIEGDSPDMAISPPSEILCMPGDLILLMSDGVCDNLFDEEIEAYCTFAISPEEACELGDPSAYTSAQDIAYSITNIAKRRSGDKLHSKPFLPYPGKYREPNKIYKGNKVDDISCVAIWVVCENEDSVKYIAMNPNEPSILETDKYYSNNYFHHFNKLTDMCTPTKSFIKEKNRIERVNLKHSNSKKGETQTTFSNSNSTNMVNPFNASFFDSSETPIKFNDEPKSGNYEDLSDMVLRDDDEEEEDENYDDSNNMEFGQYQNLNNKNDSKNKQALLPSQEEQHLLENNPLYSNASMDDMLMKTPNNNMLKEKYRDEIFNQDDFDHTPRQRMLEQNLDEQIEKINNMYIKTPLLHVDKTNKDNSKKNKSPTKCKIKNKSIDKKMMPLMYHETPKKQSQKNNEKQNKSMIDDNYYYDDENDSHTNNPDNLSDDYINKDSENMVTNFEDSETQVKIQNSKTSILRINKKIANSKRKYLSPGKLDSPSKINLYSKRSKKT